MKNRFKVPSQVSCIIYCLCSPRCDKSVYQFELSFCVSSSESCNMKGLHDGTGMTDAYNLQLGYLKTSQTLPSEQFCDEYVAVLLTAFPPYLSNSSPLSCHLPSFARLICHLCSLLIVFSTSLCHIITCSLLINKAL